MESKYAGFMGKVLMVDLTSETVSDYPWSDEQRELYLGGKIMAARILWDHLTGKEKAFSEENWIVISTGPLTGTGAPSSVRFNISGLSPQTGILASSNCGGSFGLHLKKAGYDALILKGKCNSHKWLEINEDQITFHNADALWGMKTRQCQQKLAELTGKQNFGKLCIGPAGENLVKYAGIISDERAAGRTGLGAVLGWKKLKAITVTGSKTIPIYDKEKTTQWCKKWFAYLQQHPITGNQLPKVGTASLVSTMQIRGLLSNRNNAAGQHEDFESVSGERPAEEFKITNKGCLTCPIRCARTVQIQGMSVKGPELETLSLLGGNICSKDPQKILDWNYELDELGMDTISTANTIAWAMEANKNGLWNNKLSFGKVEDLTALFDDIAHRRGIGDELAEGSKRLSKKYGGKKFTMHSKGLELDAHAPRKDMGQGLGLHVNAQTPKAKADFTMLFQDLTEAISASGQCLFTAYAFFPSFLFKQPDSILTRAVNKVVTHAGGVVRLLNKYPRIAALHLPVFHHTRMIQLATGMHMDFGKYIQIGERGYTMERCVNCKFGISAANDKLPKRLTDVPQDPKEPKTKVPLETMKKTYYAARGWDKNGIPTEATLRRLKIK